MSVNARRSETEDFGLTAIPQQPHIGAEISGIDLRNELSDDRRDQLRKLLLEFKVLFFRDQKLTRDQHIEFGRRFGNLDVHPLVQADEPLIQAISAEAFKKNAARVRSYTNRWHSDETFRVAPPLASILRAVEVPDFGGDTLFANAAATYDGLTDDVKERIEKLEAVHSLAHGFAWHKSPKWDELNSQFPPVTHPVVRVHPETGANVLFVNSVFTSHIAGRESQESDRLLGHLNAQFTRPEYQVRFKWRRGSVAFWDNRATQHYGVWDFGDATRELERVTVKGQPII
ncbi:MAG: TauD/TfdA family dioxygenase [Candidatus Binataceae bacterium]